MDIRYYYYYSNNNQHVGASTVLTSRTPEKLTTYLHLRAVEIEIGFDYDKIAPLSYTRAVATSQTRAHSMSS